MKVEKQNPGRTNQKLVVQFPQGAGQDSWHVRVKSAAKQSFASADVVVASYLDHLARHPRCVENRLMLSIPMPV